LDARGRCAAGGVAANIGLGEPVAQTRTGLRLKAPAPARKPPPARTAAPPSVVQKEPEELQVMSAAKLWQIVQHLQSLGGGGLPILPSHREGMEAWVLKAQRLLAVTPGTQAAGAPSELGQAAKGGFYLDVAELPLPRGGSVREEHLEARKLRLQRRCAAEGGTPAAGQ
ncbi:unnamed protein product, partial [Symbiodinium pilosum]